MSDLIEDQLEYLQLEGLTREEAEKFLGLEPSNPSDSQDNQSSSSSNKS